MKALSATGIGARVSLIQSGNGVKSGVQATKNILGARLKPTAIKDWAADKTRRTLGLHQITESEAEMKPAISEPDIAFHL